MDDNPKNPGDSSGDVEELRRRLAEAEGTLDAIRRGMVDAFVVEDGQGERVYTLKGADKAYSVFIETINEGLVALDSSNNILYSNTAFAHLVGSSPDRVSGSSAHRFIQEEDRPLFDRLMAQSIGGLTSRREFSILTETGDLVPMCLSFSNLEIAGINGACIVLTDLTEQKRAARDLQEQYSVLSSILESSNSPIFSIDADYLYSSFNNSHAAAMKALYGADIELGKSILAYMTVEEDRIEAKRNLDRALQGGQFVESAYSGDEGHSRKYFEVSHNPIRNKRGEVTGVAVFAIDNTESKRAEETLRKSEEKYRLLYDNAGEAIFSYDPELRLTDINRVACEAIGYSREEILGKNVLELNILHPRDLELAATLISRHFAGENVLNAEYAFIRKDGSERLFSLISAAIRDPDGNLQSITNMCRDITERKEAEESLRRTSEYLESLLDYANAPIIVWDNEFKVQRFNHAFERLAGYEADEVINRELSLLFPVETREESLGKIERTLSGERWESVEIPILRKDGSMRVALWNSANIYDKDGKTIIATIAQGQDITDRKQAEEVLRESERSLKIAQEMGLIGSWEFDVESQEITWSDETYVLYDRDPALGPPTVEEEAGYYSDEQSSMLLEYSRRAIEEERDFKYDLEARMPTGRRVFYTGTMQPVKNEGGRVVKLFGTVQDITERKQAEEELRLKESAISTSINGIAIANMERRLTYVNRAFLDLHGYESLDEVLGREIVEFVEDERELAPVMSELLEKGSWVGGGKARKKDGLLFDGQFTTSVIVDDRGKPVAMLATMLDITERKQAEKVLEESESRFRLLTEKMGDLLWTTDLRMNSTYVSPSVEAILGFTPDEYSKVPIQERVTLESLQSSGEILTDELQGDKKRNPGRSYIIDLEFYHKDGSVRNMETSLSLVRDDNGDPVGIYGLSRDVTERKRAEESLEENKARLEAINNEAMDALLLVDKKGILHHWNPAAERIFGYLSEETLGRSIEILIPEPQRREYVDAIEEFINTGVQRLTSKEPTEFVALKKDGTEIYTEIAVSRLEIGDEWYAELTVRDITERKEAKDELLKLEGELYEALDTLPDLMFEVDGGGVIHDYHAPQTDLLYISPSDVIGKTVEEALPENASRSIMDAISNGAVSTEGHGYATYSLEMPDGTHWYEASIAPKGKIGNDRLVALVRDITERKWAEEALKQYATQLEAANTELESFSYSVSHDLRAPLRAVKGFGKMLLKKHSEELDEEGKRLLDIIISNTEAMEGLIEGLLMLSGINREDLRTEKLDMISLAKDCIGELDVEGRDVEFIVHNLPSAEGGRTLVHQVFLNLISNAVKFTGKKEKAVIEIGSETQNGQDVYFVKDNGDGFDVKHSDNLFGVFKRLHKEDEFPGLGIGLATVQRIINMHGGKVWGEGEKGEGATFYFFLPVKEVRWKKNSVS